MINLHFYWLTDLTQRKGQMVNQYFNIWPITELDDMMET